MNKRRMIMLLSVLIITILTASGFYLLTGEADSGGITIISNVKADGDWEKVYGDKNAPYGSSSNPYYIRYTGAETGRTTVDLKDEKAGLKIADGYPQIFGQKITSTYKMFSDNSTLYRVFIPASIAFAEDDTSLTNAKYKGIQENTFSGDSQEIDCIYKTPNVLTGTDDDRGSGLAKKDSSGNLIYDKTGINYTNTSGITTYVSLDSNNIDRGTGSGSNSYDGAIANVYVDSVENITYLFNIASSGTEIKNVLLNENGGWDDLTGIFQNQTFTKLPNSFSLPKSTIKLNGAFQHCEKLQSLPSKFVLPEKVYQAGNLFCDDYELQSIAEDILTKNCNNLVNLNGAFGRCYMLSGTIEIPESVKGMNFIFDSAGRDSKKDIKNGCPIVMKYSTSNIPSLAYSFNVKGLSSNGKVYKQLYDWEVIQDNNGPYNDSYSGMKYYLHYRGSDKKIDLGVANGLLTLNENKKPVIFNTVLTSTYKMFSRKSEYDNDNNLIYTNETINRVLIPSSIVYKDNPTSVEGFQANMFLNTTQEIDCIYRTPNLKEYDGTEITERGSGLKANGTYDKTNVIGSTSSNVTTYVSLDSNNITRKTGSVSNSYNGTITNVYVDKSVESIHSLFMYRGTNNGFTASIIQYDSTPMNKVLLDEDGTWTSSNNLFTGQLFEELPNNFELPASITNLNGLFFGCTALKKLPENFKISQNATQLGNTFCDCWVLEELPDSLTSSLASSKVQNMNGAFARSFKLSASITIPSSVLGMKACFGDGTGKNAGKTIENTGCPIVMEYSTDNIPALTLRDNIKGLVSNGYVYKQQYDWEAIQDSNGPYTDSVSGIKYYIHYRGNDEIVDLDTAKGLLTLNSKKEPVIFNTVLTSTYKMFERRTEYDSKNNIVYTDEKINRVLVPSSIAFKSNPTSVQGLQANTFLNTTQEIDCIYRTPSLGSLIDERGTGLKSGGTYDKTSVIGSTSSNVATYVSLNSNNIARTSGSTSNSYNGTIANVYVEEMGDIAYLFYHISNSGTEIKKVLFNEQGGWTHLECIFSGQSFTELPSSFALPEKTVFLNAAFQHCEKLQSLPNNFTLPSYVNQAGNIFCDDYELQSVSEKIFANCTSISNLNGAFGRCNKFRGSVIIPRSTAGVLAIFLQAGTNVGTYVVPGFSTPIVMYYYDGCTAAEGYAQPSNVTKKSLGTYTGQSLTNQSQPVVISDVEDNNTDTVATSSDNDKVVIEDETEWVTVTVTKKSVDEVVTETQTSSKSEENVSSDNKSEEDETQE